MPGSMDDHHDAPRPPLPPKKSGKPRIPDHLRRRALVSCDRCKQRRIRCLRSNGGSSSNGSSSSSNGSSSSSSGNEPCQNCVEAAVTCKSTLPRKTRIYGSVESLSLRYRVLDALVKGLFPDQDTSSLEALSELAERHGISLADLQQSQPPANEDIFHASHVSPDHATSLPPTPIKEEAPPPPPVPVPPGKPERAAQERLVSTPAGRTAHYIGPSSSFGFSLAVRNLVAGFSRAMGARQSAEQAKMRTDFAYSNWSKALEPKASEERRTAPNPEDMLIDHSPPARHPHETIFGVPVEYSAIREQQRKAMRVYLPSRETADVLVQAFFDYVHPNYPLFHRPTFDTRYAQIWQHGEAPLSQHEPGVICALFMMFVFGMQVLQEGGKPHEKLANDYIDMVQSRVYQLISSSSVANIQALLLAQLYVHNNSERNTAFMLLGCASRMAMALGMHRETGNASFTPEERELRRRIWWTLYLFEQNSCTILGRPAILDEIDISTNFPNENSLDACECVPAGYVEYTAHLARIVAGIRRKIYYDPAQRGEPVQPSRAIQLLLDLESWHRSLPPRLRLEDKTMPVNHLRAIFLLHVQYYNAQAFLTRPFKLRKVTVQIAKTVGQHVRSQDLEEDELRLSEAASVACCRGIHLLNDMMRQGIFYGLTWLDGYYLYHQVFILAFDYLGREPPEREIPDDQVRKKAIRDVMGALHGILLCPSFSVLTQVAFQLSKIVGIFNDPTCPAVSNSQAQPAPPAPPTPSGLEHILIKPCPSQQSYPTPPFTMAPPSLSSSQSPLNPMDYGLNDLPQLVDGTPTPGADIIHTPFFDKTNPLSPANFVDYNYFGDAYNGPSPFVGFAGIVGGGGGITAPRMDASGSFSGAPSLNMTALPVDVTSQMAMSAPVPLVVPDIDRTRSMEVTSPMDRIGMVTHEPGGNGAVTSNAMAISNQTGMRPLGQQDQPSSSGGGGTTGLPMGVPAFAAPPAWGNQPLQFPSRRVSK